MKTTEVREKRKWLSAESEARRKLNARFRDLENQLIVKIGNYGVYRDVDEGAEEVIEVFAARGLKDDDVKALIKERNEMLAEMRSVGEERAKVEMQLSKWRDSNLEKRKTAIALKIEEVVKKVTAAILPYCVDKEEADEAARGLSIVCDLEHRRLSLCSQMDGVGRLLTDLEQPL